MKYKLFPFVMVPEAPPLKLRDSIQLPLGLCVVCMACMICICVCERRGIMIIDSTYYIHI